MIQRPNIDERLCFVLMPFAEPFNEQYNGIIKPVVAEAELKAVRADEIYSINPIIRDIGDLIWKARVVIADVSTKNPNVNYELGMCHAVGVPTILIANNIDDVPFDYRHRRCIIYDTGKEDWEDDFRTRLKNTLEAVISESSTILEFPWQNDAYAFNSFTAAPPAKAYPKLLNNSMTLGYVTLWTPIYILLYAGVIPVGAASTVAVMMLMFITVKLWTYASSDE